MDFLIITITIMVLMIVMKELVILQIMRLQAGTTGMWILLMQIIIYELLLMVIAIVQKYGKF